MPNPAYFCFAKTVAQIYQSRAGKIKPKRTLFFDLYEEFGHKEFAKQIFTVLSQLGDEIAVNAITRTSCGTLPFWIICQKS